MIENQIKSRKRVEDHGEVFTNQHEVNSMLDLVKNETSRIESRFLEPACGDGNFLSSILDRKLQLLKPYKDSELEFSKKLLVAISNIYGIEILEDNAQNCRIRLKKIAYNFFLTFFNENKNLLSSIEFILEKNIIHGDALTLKKVDGSDEHIVFTEWSIIGDKFQMRDFTFQALLNSAGINELPLFSDMGEDVYIPTPIKEYPLTYFINLGEDV